MDEKLQQKAQIQKLISFFFLQKTENFINKKETVQGMKSYNKRLKSKN